LGGKLSLYFNGKKVQEQAYQFQNDKQDISASFYIQVNSPGVFPLRAELSYIDGEQNIQNNYFTVFVEVTDTRKKIALISDGPHPDLGAIKHALSKDENFEVNIVSAQDFNLNEDYNLIILHSIPSNNASANNLFTTLKNKKIPLW